MYTGMPRLTPVSAADVVTPDQGDGSADGLSHEADSALIEGTSTGQGPDVDPPDGALPQEWPDLPEDADTLAPPDPEPAGRTVEEEAEPEVTGFDPDTSVELVEERDEHSRTFENEDGTLSTDFSLEPLHFEEEDGSWEEIDPSLVPENSLTWTNSADSREVDFAASADADALAHMELDEEHSLSFSLEGAQRAQGEVSEDEPDTIVYPEALPGVDIELTSLIGGAVKETIWLQEAPATQDGARWRFPLDLGALDPVQLEDGSIDLVNADGDTVGHIPAGYMEDSDRDPHSGDGAFSEAVEFTLIEESDGWVLEVVADFEWLTDENRVYPVAVDPTSTWNYNASQDTYVQSGYNTSRYTEQQLKAGTYDGGSHRAASYLRFNAMVDELSDHKIFGAKLYLFNHWSYSCTPSPVYVHEVTQSWSQKSISNYPGPSYNSTPLGSESFARGWMPIGASSSSCPARYEGIDLGTGGRDLVQAWVDGDKSNHGLSVRASATDSNGWKKFGSRESWGAPYMTVTYSPYRADYEFVTSPPEFDPAPHANRGTSVDVQVTNRGHETWTPDNGYELSYQVFDQDGNRVYHIAPTTPMPTNVATGETVTVNAKIDPLPPGTWTIKFDMTHEAQSFADWGVPRTAQVSLEIPDLPPQLLDYSPRDGARVATLTPEFTALGQNNDAWPTEGMEFWFNFCDGEWPDWECVDSGWQTETSWQLPDGLMAWGNQYWWNVFVRDGSQEVESGWLRLIADPDQPAVTSNLSGSDPDGYGTVNALIGNYTQTVTDAVVPTVGPPLSITRTYNSSDPRQDGIFGAGWSTRFDMDLVRDVDGTGNVVITYPNGSQHRFARNADGSFTPPSGMHAVLAETAIGWRLMDKASTSYVFDDTGRLLEVTDHQGRSQSIAYDASGNISTVTSDGGRSLDFGWQNGRVTSVTAQGDETSAQWTYTYDGQRLTEACNPELECTTYTYATGSHYRAAAMDANPYGYWRFEEGTGETSANEVPTQLGGEDAEITGSALGAQGALAGITSNALASGQGAYAELPNSILHRVGARITVEAWFSTTAQGTVIGALDKPTDPTQRTQLVYVGNDGKLRAQFWTADGVDPITTAQAVNDGQWHHVALTSDGTSQTLYLDGEEIGSKTGQVEHRDTRFVYVGYGMGNSGWPETLPSLGDFPFEGQIDEVAVYQRPLHPDTIALHHISGVDPADRLDTVTSPELNQIANLSFDESTSRVSIHTDHNGGKWLYSDLRYTGDVNNEEPEVTAEVAITDPRVELSATRYDALAGYRRVGDVDQLGHETTYAYDTGGFLVATTMPSGAQLRFYNDERGNRIGQMSCRDVAATNCSWEWFGYHHNPDDPFDPRNNQLTAHHDARSADLLDPTYRTWWAYDTHGNQVSETSPATADFPDGRTVRYFYTDGTEEATGGGTVPAGLLAESWDADGGTTRYSYNGHGDITSVTEPSGLVTEYTYDGLGRVLTTTVTTSDHPNGITTTRTYDDAGRVLTETGPAVTNELTDTAHQARTSFVYDKDGNVVRQAVSDLTGGEPDRTTLFAYNQYGHLVAQTDPEGRTEHFGYDFTGAQTYHQDASGTEFRTTYTARGHVAERTIEGWVGHPDEDNAPAQLVLESNAYDPDGRLASTTDAVGRTTAYTYYADGLPAQTIAVGAMLNDANESRDVVLEEYTYDAAGNPVRTVTNDGATRVDMVWNADSRLVSETLDPEGLARVTSHTYDGRGNTLSIALTDPTGRTEQTRYAYDAGGRVIEEAVQISGGELVTSYEVNELGLVTAVTDPRGNEEGADASAFTSLMRYDELGRLVEEQLPQIDIEHYGEPTVTDRPTSRFGYDLVGNLTHQQDAEGNTSVFGYDLVGQQTDSQAPSFTGADGTQITPQAQTTYDELGRIATQIDALGNTRTYTWDQLGNLAGITDPPLNEGAEPGQWTFVYNPVGELLATTNPVGARIEATYDDLGRQVTDTQIERIPAAAAYTTRYAYDAMGNTTSVTDPLGNITASTYNAAGELVSTTNPAGETTSFDHDLAGRTSTVTDPVGTQVISEFDLAGRQTRTAVLAQDGTELRAQSVTYDAAGLPVSETDPLGNTVTTEFNALGQPTSRVEPVSDTETITTTFGYDSLGQQTRLTDGRGNSTHTTYTPSGQVAQLIEPATDATPAESDRTWTTFYDAAGNPVQQHVPGGVVRQREFTALGGLSSESATGAEATTQDRHIGYDQMGRPTSIGTANGGAIEIVYDDRGNQVQFLGPNTVSYDGMTPGTTISFDGAGRATTRLDLTGTTTFGYDAAGRVIEHHDSVTGEDLSIAYDQAGRTESITTQDGTVRNFTHDPLGQLTEDVLTSPSGERLLGTTYTYDAAGRITARTTEGVAPAGTHKFDYDYASRLTSWTAPGGEITEYEWDASGNRVREGDETFAFDERNRLVSSSGGDTWSYTPRGTVSSQFVDGGLRTPEFDGFNRMVSSGDGSGEYAYDALGRLAERTTSSGTEWFVYADLENDPIAVLDGTESTVAQYGRDPYGQVVSVFDRGQTPALAYNNSHGDLVATYTGTGTVTSTADFGPFGEQLGASPVASVGYQGEWTDPETGDVNMHARWYQPGSGRFASRDTMTLEPNPSVQANRYTYGNANPVLYADPSGHLVFLAAIPALAGGGAVAGGAAVSGAAIGNAVVAGLAIGASAWAGWEAYNAFSGSYASTNTSSKGFRVTRHNPKPKPRPRPRGGERGGTATATATGSDIVYRISGVVSSFRFRGGGDSGRPYIPIIVDNRKEILEDILNTPQDRPPMAPVVSGEGVNSHRKQREEDFAIEEEIPFDASEYDEYDEALEGLDDISGFDIENNDGECRPFIELSEINNHGQRGTAVGRFCGQQDLNRGPRYEPESDPPGYVYGQDNRAHLIGSNFFGPGQDENIVATYERTNKSGMGTVERRVAAILAKNNEVIYVATPVYEGAQDRPWAVHMTGIASNGQSWDHCILNNGEYFKTGGRVDGSVCGGPKPTELF